VFPAFSSREVTLGQMRKIGIHFIIYPARIGRLSAGVGRRHPVTIRKASLVAGTLRRVWALRHHTGYFAVEWTRDKVTVRNVVAQAPSSSQRATSRVRRVMSTFCEVTRGVGDTWATCLTLLRGIWVRSRSRTVARKFSILGSLRLLRGAWQF